MKITPVKVIDNLILDYKKDLEVSEKVKENYNKLKMEYLVYNAMFFNIISLFGYKYDCNLIGVHLMLPSMYKTMYSVNCGIIKDLVNTLNEI